jgi:hypothetical protein
MAYNLKSPKLKEKKTFEIEKEIPYEDKVKTFANPYTKEVMWVKREYLGKGWYATYVNGKLVDKSRNVKSSYEYVPENFKEVSLFSEMSYHSGLRDKGKITKYGMEDYTLQYSDYKPIGEYKLQSPLKTSQKDEFGEVKNKVEFQKWNYVVLNWKPEGNKTKLQIVHKTSTPYGEKKEIYKSKEYDISERKEAIKDFRNYVAKIKKEKF